MRVLIVLVALAAQLALARHDFLAHSFPESHWLAMFLLTALILACHKTNKASR